MCVIKRDGAGCCGSGKKHEDNTMCFKRAISELMKGIPVTRMAWNGSDKGLSDKYLALLDGKRFDKETGEICLVNIREFSFNEYILTKEDVESHDWVYAHVCSQGG